VANAYTDPSKFTFANPLNAQQQQFNQTIGLGGQNNVNKAYSNSLMGPGSSPNASLQLENAWGTQYNDPTTNPDVLHNILGTYTQGGNNLLGAGYSPIQQSQRDVLAQTRGTRPDYASTPLTQIYGNAPSTGTTSLSNLANPATTQSTPGPTPGNPSGLPYAAPDYSNYITNPSAYLDPSMAFTMKQGMDQLQNSAAAQGNLLSGQTLKGIENYAQGLAGTNWQNAFSNAQNDANRLYGIDNNDRNFAYGAAVNDRNFNNANQQFLSGQGLNATNNQSSLARALSSLLSANTIAAGQTQAGGTLGGANNINSLISSLLGQYNSSNNLGLLQNLIGNGGT